MNQENMKFYYNYDAMEDRAAEIERKLPALIKAGDWEQIAESIKVPESAWSGTAATKYREACEKIVAAKDSYAVMKTPMAIRSSVQQMKERDAKAAAAIRQGFSNLHF